MIRFNDDSFKYYFYFMQERMTRFWNRYGESLPETDDPVLNTYKFTNVYRACDRVSQYLIRHVIYNIKLSSKPEDLCLRILIFKIFNRISTWEYILEEYGEITADNFSPEELSRLLSRRQKARPIFSNAYMMTGSHHLYNHLAAKHEKWLAMVKNEILDGDEMEDLLSSSSLEDVYIALRKKSFLGDFLAYQYAVDLNYSPLFHFSENDFVKTGIGALRGIKKCVSDPAGRTPEEIICFVHENLPELRDFYGFTGFRPLPGRDPSLMDLQNCFCETDKYLRAVRPELDNRSCRIKQKFAAGKTLPPLYFPEKWGIRL